MKGKLIPWSAALLGGLLVARAAQAQIAEEVDCPSFEAACVLDGYSLVVTGSPALDPVFKKMSAALKKANGIEIYYVRNVGQCYGARQVMESLDLAGRVANRLGERCCTFRPGAQADVWVTDAAVEDCFDGQKPMGYRDFVGPIAAYSMVVPRSSPQRAITMEEAYFVFGFGSPGYKGQTVTPWTDVAHFVIPGVAYGTQALWAKFLRLPSTPRMNRTPQVLPAEPVKGVEFGGPELVIPAMLDPFTGGEGAIGLTTAQAYDSAAPATRIKVRTLAVQGWKQKAAFYPDSTASAFDKRNVRVGRYPYWSPTHYVTKADVTGRPLNARAEVAINYLTQTTPLPGVNVLDAIVAGHLIPTCAMKVQRASKDGDAGDLAPYTPLPGTACGCYMDELIQAGSSGCAPCSPTKPCSGGKMCSNGFCE